MRVAIPLANGKLSLHFGHCELFALVDIEPKEKAILQTQRVEPPPHEPGVLPKWLGEQGAQVIIAGGMGQRAVQLFLAQGIEVVVGAPPESPEDLVTAYMDGTLQTGANACDH